MYPYSFPSMEAIEMDRFSQDETIVKNLILGFVENLFLKINSFPIEIRLICKKLKDCLKEKVILSLVKYYIFNQFPDLEVKIVNTLITSIILEKWILPNYTCPNHSEIYFEIKDNNLKNLVLIRKVFFVNS